MDSFAQVLYGFAVAAQPMNLLFLFIGAVLGTVIGMMPGIHAAAGIGILLPLTFSLDPIPSLIMLAGIYYGAMYGNTASAVLINTPGTASAVMTTVDGYPMAKKGRGGAALAIAAIASFIAGTISVIFLTLLAMPLAKFALRFGPAEYFALMVFSLSAVSSLTGKSVAKGLIAAIIGLMIGMVGRDLHTGMERFTFGVFLWEDGIPFIVVIVGLFGISEVLIKVEKWFEGELHPIKIKGKLWLTFEEWRQSYKAIIRGGIIGFFVGVLPGAGGTIATVLAYSTEQRFSSRPEKFGTGIPEGVAAPEAANNASTGGAFVPLLTLGIPGSGSTAVLLGAFILFGIQPGPELFANRPDLVWGLVDSMYLGNVILLILNLPLIGIFVRLLYTPPGMLMSIIIGVATIGVYSLRTNVVDLYCLVFFGAVGYIFKKLKVPLAPLILSLVLGDMMEQSLRQAMTLSMGKLSYLVSSPISSILLIMAVSSLFFPMLSSTFKRKKSEDNGEKR
jgi:putative tricarboxylic transport membrane protein